MNSLERVLATIQHQPVDRIPIIPEVAAVTGQLTGNSVYEYISSGETLAKCQLEGWKYFQYDAVIAFADLCVEAEALGCKIKFQKDNYPYVTEPLIKERDQLEHLDQIQMPDPKRAGRMKEIIKSVEIMKEQTKGTLPIVAHALGPLTIASRIMDIEAMLYLIVDEPLLFRKLLDFTTKVSANFAQALVEAGADCIIMFNPSASPAVLPAKIFREFELPNLQKIFSTLKKDNPEIITWYSVAGAVQDMIKDIELVQIDILTIDYLVPLEVAFELSSTLCFNGNIKPFAFVNNSPEEIIKESMNLLNIAAEQGRFILGVGCEVPPDGKIANIKALVTAVEKFSTTFEIIGEKKTKHHLVTLHPFQKKIYVQEDTDLLSVAHLAGASISKLCNKSGVCGSCLVQIQNGRVNKITRQEVFRLDDEQKKAGYRLACQVKVTSDIEVFIPLQSRLNQHLKVRIDHIQNEYFQWSWEKIVETCNIKSITIPKNIHQGKEEQTDWEILSKLIGNRCSFPLKTLRQCSEVLRDSENDWYLVIDQKENQILDFHGSPNLLGMVIDIGTSNLIVYIHDLKSGKLLTSGSMMNPQSLFGDNIMSRAAEYIKDSKKRKKLTFKLFDGINQIIVDLSKESGINWNEIYKTVVVGNSVMHHMFLGLDIKYMIRSPFTPVTRSQVCYINYSRSKHERISMNKRGKVYCPPLLNGFVGSDAIMGVLSSEMYKSEDLTLFIDLGTNGEIVLGNKHRLVATSVAAGPAFEFSHLSSGRSAGSGVIYQFEIDSDFNNKFRTFNGRRASGLCGSAIIDATAELLRLGLLNSKGRFVANSECTNLTDEGYLLVSKQNTAFFKPILMSQDDVQEVQKTKAGIMAGIKTLMRIYEISEIDLEKIVLTGAFGVTTNIKNAIRIGLIPNVEKEKISFLSNAAGVGARLSLLSEEADKEMIKFVNRVEHIDLTKDDRFHNCFIESMFF